MIRKRTTQVFIGNGSINKSSYDPYRHLGNFYYFYEDEYDVSTDKVPEGHHHCPHKEENYPNSNSIYCFFCEESIEMYEHFFHTLSYGVNFLLAINRTLEELCENYKLQPQEDLYKKQGSDHLIQIHQEAFKRAEINSFDSNSSSIWHVLSEEISDQDEGDSTAEDDFFVNLHLSMDAKPFIRYIIERMDYRIFREAFKRAEINKFILSLSSSMIVLIHSFLSPETTKK
ncbi:hypothetical protein DICPUDRAFT_158406 [Dictyostelium purpureum]|uniref:Uncharacterized protein n=1 Tax=Dictyostelium purpureum TaxID=5786 RepID=F1A1J4_DICPU|nr:uncharacterized protein DICPUDRAFT_158406 [Dictyostelium purpureum]EGC29934.1 hypothetical protein DICPUDRAFT_158406 [Dictyostelium purpureum]|eukprot:XP_003293537.1 hypothetical protein DICPUDRAFT_158406 [Dictyostelium purpureum]